MKGPQGSRAGSPDEAGAPRKARAKPSKPAAGRPPRSQSPTALSARARRLRWWIPALFAVLAPPLFMLVDMSFEQATQSEGFSPARLGQWIAADGFFVLRAVWLVGVLPAGFAGLLIARREQRGGTSPLFALVLFAIFSVPVAVLFARNLFLFAPPAFAEQILIGGRVIASVVISGFVCYGLSRWITRGSR